MDKKTKKKIQVLNKKLATLRQQLKGAKTQQDDPAEVARLEEELANCESELTRLKSE